MEQKTKTGTSTAAGTTITFAQERSPKIGDIVLFTPNPDDLVAKSNHNDGDIPAIVTRVWSAICVNIKIIPDCGPMQDRTSVVHQSANPAGYHFKFIEEVFTN